ncbi:MAG: DUF4954 family protein [Bacteroidales bacterium]|nr:DUF4954 family protein [Bacteroidales bacterium]
MHRHLSSSEITQLERQHCWSANWDGVMVADPFDAALVRNVRFEGEVRVGAMAEGRMHGNGPVTLPEGITNSWLRNSEVGDHCAIHDVHLLDNYSIGSHCLLFNVGVMQCAGEMQWMSPMNENGNRRIRPFPGMTIGDAYLWARFRGRDKLLHRLDQMTCRELQDGRANIVGEGCVILNTLRVHNVSILSSLEQPVSVQQCVCLSDGVIGYGCHLHDGIIAQRFLLGEHVALESGLRLNDTVVGDNSTLACGEVGCAMIFPAHEQHHNSSFLIAALVEGQSNLASGATVGSNHNSRAADGEIRAARGFWPGLNASLKHNSNFASYCLVAKGIYPNEMNIPLPFSLVSNNAGMDQLEVMPAYWWMYNMYALDHCMRKFVKRDKRKVKAQHIDFQLLAPDTADEILHARILLKSWMDKAGEGNEVLAEGLECGKRRVVILKARQAYKAYEDMLYFYCVGMLRMLDKLPEPQRDDAEWINMGGLLMKRTDVEELIRQIEDGDLKDWDEIHNYWEQTWQHHLQDVNAHAMKVLLDLEGVSAIAPARWKELLRRWDDLERFVVEQTDISRKKDDDNPFRHCVYFDEDEYNAVLHAQ